MAALAVAPVAARACSECLCGTPFPADALGGVVPLQIRYGVEDRYLSKSNGLEGGSGEEREREHRMSGFVLWRPQDKLALLARLPYNFKEIREAPSDAPARIEKARGIGDAELLALVGVWQGAAAHPATLGAVFGVSAPTGSNDQRDDGGERLDAHLQPGTGAWSGTVGLNLGIASGRGTLEAGVLGRLNGRSGHGYRYGRVLLYNLGYASPERHGLAFVTQVNGRSAARDRFEGGALGENTGGTVVYASPGIRWRGHAGVGVEGALQVPVLTSLFGDQDEHTTARLAISLSR